MIICKQNLVKCPFIFNILSKNQILTSIKGRNSVANLRKMTHYNPNVDIVNDNVYTKFGLNPFIPSPDIEQQVAQRVTIAHLTTSHQNILNSSQVKDF